MPFQDDEREKEMISSYGLESVEGRTSTDALLKVDGKELEFELKSTQSGSVTTVRDFGPEHIKKWKTKHWLIGVYDKKELLYCWYASPRDMAPWIKSKEEYIQADFDLADHVPELINVDILHTILGDKEFYSLEDARRLHKRQYSKDKYMELMDTENGYSKARMLRILQDRCKYVIERGSTLNNPHIPKTYFNGWIQIKPGDKKTLLKLVREYLDN